MVALIIKEFRELGRDKGTLALLLILPIMLLIIFGYAANFHVDRVTVTIIGPKATSVANELSTFDTAKDKIDIVHVDDSLNESDAEKILRNQKSDAVVVALPTDDSGLLLSDRIHTYADGTMLFNAQATQGTFLQLRVEEAQRGITDLKKAIDDRTKETNKYKGEMDTFGDQLKTYSQRIQESILTNQPLPDPPTPPRQPSASDLPELTSPDLDANKLVTVLYNPDLITSWVIVPGLIGLILLFIGTLIASIGLVRERESGTLEQLAVMPLRPSEIILGKIIPYFLISLLDIAIITILARLLFNVPFIGKMWIFILAAVLFCFLVIGLGVFISSLARNASQAIQIAILFVVPQVLLAGIFFPLKLMPLIIRCIAYVLPLTWFREIAQGVMLRNSEMDFLWMPFVILSLMTIIIVGVATLRMRHSLTHGNAR